MGEFKNQHKVTDRAAVVQMGLFSNSHDGSLSLGVALNITVKKKLFKKIRIKISLPQIISV